MKSNYFSSAWVIATFTLWFYGCNDNGNIVPEDENGNENIQEIVIEQGDYRLRSLSTEEIFLCTWKDESVLQIEQYNVPCSEKQKSVVEISVRADTIYIYENTGNVMMDKGRNPDTDYSVCDLFFSIENINYQPYTIQIVREGAIRGYRAFDVGNLPVSQSTKVRYVPEENDGTGTYIEREIDGLLLTFELLNENDDRDHVFEYGEQIAFRFSVKNNTEKRFSYDSRDILKIAEYGKIYQTETNAYMGRASACITDNLEDDLYPGQTKQCRLIYYTVPNENIIFCNTEEQKRLEPGHYYTGFSGFMDGLDIHLPELRIDFEVK